MSVEKKQLDYNQSEAHQRTLSGVYSESKMKHSVDLEEEMIGEGSDQGNSDEVGVGDISLKLVVNVSMSP